MATPVFDIAAEAHDFRRECKELAAVDRQLPNVTALWNAIEAATSTYLGREVERMMTTWQPSVEPDGDAPISGQRGKEIPERTRVVQWNDGVTPGGDHVAVSPIGDPTVSHVSIEVQRSGGFRFLPGTRVTFRTNRAGSSYRNTYAFVELGTRTARAAAQHAAVATDPSQNVTAPRARVEEFDLDSAIAEPLIAAAVAELRDASTNVGHMVGSVAHETHEVQLGNIASRFAAFDPQTFGPVVQQVSDLSEKRDQYTRAENELTQRRQDLQARLDASTGGPSAHRQGLLRERLGLWWSDGIGSELVAPSPDALPFGMRHSRACARDSHEAWTADSARTTDEFTGIVDLLVNFGPHDVTEGGEGLLGQAMQYIEGAERFGDTQSAARLIAQYGAQTVRPHLRWDAESERAVEVVGVLRDLAVRHAEQRHPDAARFCAERLLAATEAMLTWQPQLAIVDGEPLAEDAIPPMTEAQQLAVDANTAATRALFDVDQQAGARNVAWVIESTLKNAALEPVGVAMMEVFVDCMEARRLQLQNLFDGPVEPGGPSVL